MAGNGRVSSKTLCGPLAGTDLVVATIRVRDAWNALKQHRESLATALCNTDAHLPAWTAPDASGTAARAAAAKIYGDMLHVDKHVTGTETSRLAGVLAASQKTIAAAERLNAAKAAFRDALLAIPEDQQADVLRRFGAARVHRKQAYRKIVVLKPILLEENREVPVEAPVVAIGWGWTRKVADYEPVDREMLVANLLEAAPYAQDAAEDLATLRGLPADAELVELKPGAMYLVTNARYESSDGERARRTFFTAMPVLVPHSKLPLFRPLRHGPSERRLQLRRRDAKTSAAPILPSVNVYLRTP